MKLTIEPIQRLAERIIGNGRVHPFALSHNLVACEVASTVRPYEPRHRDAAAARLTPNFVRPIHIMIVLPDPLNMYHQMFITLGATTAQGWVALPAGMVPIPRRCNLQP